MEMIVNGLQNDERREKCNRKELHKKEIVKGKAGRWEASRTCSTFWACSFYSLS